MKITFNDAKKQITIEALEDFDAKQIFTCGQCFRWRELDHNYFRGVVANRVVDLEQISPSEIRIHRTESDFYKQYFHRYLDLDTDYSAIKKVLMTKDQIVKTAITHGEGIRILNQDPFELLLSFIISGNNNIPRISNAIKAISENYGTFIERLDGEAYYGFPSAEQLRDVGVDDFRKLGVGYRDKYLYDAVQGILNQRVDLEQLKTADYKTLKDNLMLIKGVGSKVADCIILFAYQEKSAFPVDTWVKKIIATYYDESMTNDKAILKFADDHFGAYAGVAQQYLFYYARKMKL